MCYASVVRTAVENRMYYDETWGFYQGAIRPFPGI